MSILTKNSQFSFRTNDELLRKAKEIAMAENFDMTTIMNSVLTKIVEQRNVPVELVDEKSQRHEKIVKELYGEIEKGYQSYKEGRVKPMSEVFSKYGL